MNKTFKTMLLTAALLGGAACAQAQDLQTWGAAGGWDILIDPSLGNGCLIQAEYQDGSVVRIGFDRSDGSGYVTAFNEAWGEIEEGAVYDIQFALDSQIYQGTARGIYLNGVPGADVIFDSPDFLFDIAKRYTMTLYNGDEEVMSIDLEGSYVALQGAMECQGNQG